ncbi:MAG: hypothetical protein ABI539_06490 [Acidobacteriota bacterium]
MSDPLEMQNFIWLKQMSGSVAVRGGLWAEAGKIYPGPDGHRFFYGVYEPSCIYVLVKANAGHEHKLGKFFQQDKAWFAEDISRHGFEGEMHLGASKNVIEGFMDIFMGCAAAAGGPLAMGITGMNLVVSMGKVKQNYDTYKKAIEVLLYNRKFIEDNCKKLYAVVIVELCFGELEKVFGNQAKDALLNAVPGPKVAGKILGVFLGKMGEDRLALRLKAINKLFKKVLIKVADHAARIYPDKLDPAQVEQLAFHHVIPDLTGPALIPYLDQETAETIVREVVDACLGMQGPLKRMSAALDVM